METIISGYNLLYHKNYSENVNEHFYDGLPWVQGTFETPQFYDNYTWKCV